MNLNIGDRILLKFGGERCVEEDEVAELYGDWIKWKTHYPYWFKKDQVEVLGKLPKKELGIPLRSDFAVTTEGLDCPLLKKVCNRNCAWYIQSKKTCILLQLADDINEAVDDET